VRYAPSWASTSDASTCPTPLYQRHAPLCLPAPSPTDDADLAAEALRDPSLILRLNHLVVGNNLDAAGKSLVVITGANLGGKSTFLRAIGLALLMMQSGMFVTATHFQAGVSSGLFTHYRREEDTTMTSGKLDEELSRMSDIVDHLRPGSTVLLNESFAATNEREGSQITRQIVHALTESGVRVLLVTHLYDLAQGMHTPNTWTPRCSSARTGTAAVTARSASFRAHPCPSATAPTSTRRLARPPDTAPPHVHRHAGARRPVDSVTLTSDRQDTARRHRTRGTIVFAVHAVVAGAATRPGAATPGRHCPGCHHVLMLPRQPPDLVRRIEKSGSDPALVADLLDLASADETAVADPVHGQTTTFA
jgi:hypothetical protein